VDTSARLIQPHLQKYLGVPVVIDNMPGAGGNIGRAYVFRQPPDGYTLMVNLQPSMSAGQIVTGARFDSLQFTHIYNITGHNYDAVAVPIGSSLKTIEDIRKASQSRPLTTAGGGIGTTNYILAMLLKEKAGVQISFVPFNSGAGTGLAISGGQTEIGIAALDSLWPLYLVLGLVLGNLVEANFHRSLLIGRGSYAIFFNSSYCFEYSCAHRSGPGVVAHQKVDWREMKCLFKTFVTGSR